MKTYAFPINNLVLRFAAVLLLTGLFLTGCQQDEFSEYQPADDAAPFGETDADMKEFLLNSVYKFPTEQFSDAQIEDLYQEITAELDETQLADVNVQLRTLASQSTTPTSKPAGRSKSASGPAITAGSSTFGSTIALYGGSLIVGDPAANEVTIYQQKNGSYVVDQVLTPSNGAIQFGKSVSADGGWLAVGSGEFFPSGEVHLYQLSGGGFFGGDGEWVEKDILAPTDQAGFGSDLVVSFPYLAVIGRMADNLSASEITVYRAFGNRWTEQTRLGDGNTFYWDLDMDNGWIAANSGQGQLGPVFNPQVFVYRSGGFFSTEWNLTQQLSFPPGQFLLRAVAIDGLNIIANTAIPGNQSSAFRLQGGGWGGSGGSWVDAGILQHPLPAPFVQTRWVDVAGDKAVVCEPIGDFAPQPGDAVQVYERIDGSWQQTETLTPADGGLTNYIGVSPIIDGNQVYVGAPSSQSGTPGQVYVFD